MKYKEFVNKLNHMHDDGYFNNHHSQHTHGDGPFNQFPFYTIGTCECAGCIAHALAFGMRGHYEEKEISEDILAELKNVYGVDDVMQVVKDDEKGNLGKIFKTADKPYTEGAG